MSLQIESRIRPIAFNLEMARALHDGRKTETRRLLKIQPATVRLRAGIRRGYSAEGQEIVCPFGAPGDRLWVREPFQRAGDEFIYASNDSSARSWRAGRFMPRSASRLTLVIRSIVLERVQSIRLASAKREGYPHEHSLPPVRWFAALWDSIADDEDNWNSNPWVWVVRFEVDRANYTTPTSARRYTMDATTRKDPPNGGREARRAIRSARP